MLPPAYLKIKESIQARLIAVGTISPCRVIRPFLLTSAILLSGPASQALTKFPGNPWPFFHRGPEQVVNTTTNTDEERPRFDFDNQGNYVVVWQSQPGAIKEVYFQRFDQSGNKIGTETRVDDGSAGTASDARPSVAVDPDGDFLVVWEGYGTDSSSQDIFARRFAADGSAQGGQFRINDTTNDSQERPSVGCDSDGDFVVVWRGYDMPSYSHRVFGKRYNNDGTVDIAEQDLSGTTVDSVTPGLAVDNDGDFLITWTAYNSATANTDVFIRGFNNGFNQQIATARANNYTTGTQRRSNVSMDANGNFILVWEDNNSRDGSNDGVFAQRFNADGSTNGSEIQINTWTSNDQRKPSVAMDKDGTFVVVWQNNYSDEPSSGNYAIFGQKFDSNANPLGDEFRVNNRVTGSQQDASVMMDHQGNFLVSFTSYGLDGTADNAAAIRLFRCTVDPGPVGKEIKYDNSSARRPVIAYDEDGSHGVLAYYTAGAANYDIFFQRLDSSGGPIGAKVQANVDPAQVYRPMVAMDRDGDFLVTWGGGSPSAPYSSSVWGTLVDKDGNRQQVDTDGDGNPDSQVFRLNDLDAGDQILPACSMDTNGNFVVTWLDSQTFKYRARLFNKDGTPKNSSIEIGQYSNSHHPRWANVRMDADGSFIVAYANYSSGNSDVTVSKFDKDGNRVWTALPHGTTTGISEGAQDIDVDKDGNIIIAWTDSSTPIENRDISAVIMDKDGNNTVSPFTINDFAGYVEEYPRVSFDNRGNFAVCWHAWDSGFTNGGDVFAKFFNKMGEPLTQQFGLSHETYEQQFQPNLSHMSDGNFRFVWHAYDSSNTWLPAGITIKAPTPLTPPDTWINLSFNASQSLPLASLFSGGSDVNTSFSLHELPTSGAVLQVDGLTPSTNQQLSPTSTLTLFATGPSGSVGSFTVRATDNFSQVSHDIIIRFYIDRPSIPVKGGTRNQDYALISIPGSSLSPWSVLQSSMGEYNPYFWRIFGYRGSYAEGIDIQGINSSTYAGRGVWLIARQNTAVTISDNPINDQDVTVELQEGWNLIGNPFLISIGIEAMQVDTGNGYVNLGGQSKVGPTLYTWNTGTIGYESVNTVDQYRGAWIYSSTAATLKFIAPANR